MIFLTTFISVMISFFLVWLMDRRAQTSINTNLVVGCLIVSTIAGILNWTINWLFLGG